MIPRYTRPEMGEIWTEESKFQAWLDVEIAVCQAQCEAGKIPEKAFNEIKSKSSFDVNRINEIEAEVHHDVIAFLTCVNENVGECARFIHMGLTSSDVIDTALALQLTRAGAILTRDLEELNAAVKAKAQEHKHTIMIGRSHGIHAEPITLGFKLAVWLEEVRRHQLRLNDAIEMISVGQVSGPVGTFSNISPSVEARTCEILGLTACPVSTQVIQRDRHAQFVLTLALIASSLDKFATEIRHLQRTDVLEVEEPFVSGQKGSSAMPHKRNPIGSENISGLARLVRNNAGAALENIPLWHERDISHSSVERVILPDSTILVDFMLKRITNIIANLVVYPDNMKRNMDVFGGVIYSQAVLLKLVDKGLTREEAYSTVQTLAMQAWNRQDGDFKQLVTDCPSISKLLSKNEINALFDASAYLNNIDSIFERVGI